MKCECLEALFLEVEVPHVHRTAASIIVNFVKGVVSVIRDLLCLQLPLSRDPPASFVQRQAERRPTLIDLGTFKVHQSKCQRHSFF